MGIYTEYLDRNLDFEAMSKERKAQLKRIGELRGDRDVLVFASDVKKGGQAPISIGYPDLLPIHDQLSNLKGGQGLDVILETPGGSAETVDQIVRIIRGKYTSMAVVVPGAAMSAGTIMAMAADEILMDEASSLGPIDAQLQQQGKVFSADALLKGFERIKDEVTKTGILNKAYIPMLQAISPGELEAADNALNLAKELVRDWLAKYKFKDWPTHSSTGAPVTEEDRKTRAAEIAAKLCEHSRWRSHGRPIMIDDLTKELRLKITNFSGTEVGDAIRRYYTLLQMTFDRTPIYKIFETPSSQIFRSTTPLGAQQVQAAADVDINCSQCGTISKLQVNLGTAQPLQAGRSAFPADNFFRCPKCGTKHDLRGLRAQLEKQTGQKVV